MARVRTADELADISFADWEHMTAPERVEVMIAVEHFMGGATFDPLECDSCRVKLALLDALTQVGSEPE
jgi:hypothetical protein